MILSWRSPFRLMRAIWHAAVFLWHGMPVIAPPPIVAHRLKICGKCMFKDGKFCRKCTCLIDVKTLMASERCPDGRWAKCFTTVKKES